MTGLMNNEKKCVTVRDVDGRKTELGKLARKLRGNNEDLGGLDMAECAFRNGPCRTILKTDPTVQKSRRPIRGATTLPRFESRARLLRAGVALEVMRLNDQARRLVERVCVVVAQLLLAA